MKEVELRARTDADITKRLSDLGAQLTNESREIDKYYKFEDDPERKIVIRIRKKEGDTLLTFKGSNKEEDTSWQEWEQKVEDGEGLSKLLVSNGVVNFVTIDKNRKKYNLEDFEINVDQIKDLGTFIEAELKVQDTENTEKAKSRIKNLFAQLEVKDIINEGYVRLMLKEKGE